MKTLDVGDIDALPAAADALRAGQLIIVPTDTVYGLAALPGCLDAVQRIYQAKDRPEGLQLPVLATSLDQVRGLGVDFSPAASVLASSWWPGPLTMVFGFSTTIERPSWLAHREEVAVRVPGNEFLLALMRATGVLTVTSANRHGEATPTSADEAGRRLAPHVSLVIDAGTLSTSPSTLVNVRCSPAVVEREGTIAREVITSALTGAV